MEIGGCDIRFPGKPPAQEDVLAALREFWPALWVEDDKDDSYFVYRDTGARDMWDWDEFNAPNCPEADMVYVIPEENLTTVVIDDHGRLRPVAEAIGRLVRRS